MVIVFLWSDGDELAILKVVTNLMMTWSLVKGANEEKMTCCLSLTEIEESTRWYIGDLMLKSMPSFCWIEQQSEKVEQAVPDVVNC